MTDEPVLLSTRDSGVLTLTLNRPHRKNAVDAALWAALRAALATATHDPEVRALVLTGAGGAFCAGADISGGAATDHPLPRMHAINDIALLLHELPMPTVAKVTGVAVGAGWNMALGCDFVVATPGARFSQIFARRGLSVDFGGSWLLPRIVGLQQAKRLALLAEMIDGFVTDIGKRLAAGPPVALAQTKALLNEGVDRTMRDALASEARAQAINFATSDTAAAFAAFNEKREPSFTGAWAVG
jgi:enoyl-CoA hydratase/carnithine racemase